MGVYMLVLIVSEHYPQEVAMNTLHQRTAGCSLLRTVLTIALLAGAAAALSGCCFDIGGCGWHGGGSHWHGGGGWHCR